jgi:hypothetical protein
MLRSSKNCMVNICREFAGFTIYTSQVMYLPCSILSACQQSLPFLLRTTYNSTSRLTSTTLPLEFRYSGRSHTVSVLFPEPSNPLYYLVPFCDYGSAERTVPLTAVTTVMGRCDLNTCAKVFASKLATPVYSKVSTK